MDHFEVMLLNVIFFGSRAGDVKTCLVLYLPLEAPFLSVSVISIQLVLVL